MNNTLVIESNIPLPEPERGLFATTFKKMKVGDSVLFPGERKSYSSLAKQLGGTVATRKEEGGIRVWRTS